MDAGKPDAAGRRRAKLAALGRDVAPFVRYAVGRFIANNGPQVASALTYTALLGLVPLLAMLLAIFSAFPAFETLRETVKDMVLGPLMPTAAGQLREHLDAFLDNTRGLGGIAAIGLAVTSFMMISTFERAFGTIWRVRAPRPLVFRILLYWALLTLGPLLVGASLSLSSYIGVLADQTGVSTLAPHLIGFRVFVPALLATAAFTLLYLTVPHWPVRFAHALTGAVTATVLFEALKFGFTLYVGNGDNYRAIYGALAVLPIFLLWLYCSWCVVLFGAEVAAALPEWATVRRAGKDGIPMLVEQTPADRLAAALAVLWELWRLRGEGKGLRPSVLERMLGVRWGRAESVISDLIDRAYVVQTESGRLLLARDLASVPVGRLARDFGIGLEPGDAVAGDDAPGWYDDLRSVLAAADADLDRAMAMTIGSLFAGRTDQVSPARGS